MTTRTYYLPKSRISMHILSNLIAKIGCSIGDIKIIKDAIRVPITCNDKDIKKVEKLLYIWNMMGD